MTKKVKNSAKKIKKFDMIIIVKQRVLIVQLTDFQAFRTHANIYISFYWKKNGIFASENKRIMLAV